MKIKFICYFDEINLSSSYPNASHNWNTGETSQSISPSSSGIYWLEVSENNCSDIDSIEIEIIEELQEPYIGNDTTICNGNSIYFNLENIPANEFEWSNGLTSPDITIDQAGSYQVSISNQCETKTSDLINVKYDYCNCIMVLPNAFSPNNDGKNEFFHAQFDCIINSFDLNVFNRWGELVFNSIDPNAKWDGTYQGELLNSGVFYYFLRANVIDDNKNEDIFLKGNVTLIK